MPTGLVVDDEPDIRVVLRKVPQDERYGRRPTCNGKGGLDTAERARPDLVLLDLMMPVMDGPQFYECLRAREDGRNVPVLLLSAGRGLSATAETLGADGYLAKPFDLNELLDRVAGLLR